MKVAIISSLSQKAAIQIEEYLPENTTMIIMGGGKGINALTKKYAVQKGIPMLICPPKMFERLGTAATYGLGGGYTCFRRYARSVLERGGICYQNNNRLCEIPRKRSGGI